ncbi:hypothetical protein, partial [Paenibacillus alginolyticus]|uniref:hypothetical protein n=1 Tax=Paenibacillus alginolyticus TaxID=59839 RepID=UPI001C26DD11
GCFGQAASLVTDNATNLSSIQKITLSSPYLHKVGTILRLLFTEHLRLFYRRADSIYDFSYRTPSFLFYFFGIDLWFKVKPYTS